MALHDFLEKQFIKVIQWTESDQDTLAWRYPFRDMEIMNGAKLTVRDSEAAAFVNEGRIADVFGPGLYTLTTQTLPLLTDLMNWSKEFKSPFKSDVYFFSTRIKTDQRWGTATPITIRDKEFGAVRVRGYGIYSWHIDNPRVFYTKISGTREMYKIADLEGQLRNTIVGRMTGAFAESGVPFLDMAANQTELGAKIAEGLKPQFSELGLALDSFVVENLSLPEELQKMLDTRVGMNMIGDMGRYTQYQVANSLPIAAGNESGGIAGLGVGLGAGLTMANQMMNALSPNQGGPNQSNPNPGGPNPGAPNQGGGASPQPPPPPPAAPNAASDASPNASAGGPAPVPGAETKFCVECGKSIPRRAKFCPECGGQQ